MKYIYHHLGLGDHIICNGLVRFYQEKFTFVKVFVKKHNYENVSYMFRDNPNIEFMVVNSDDDVLGFISSNNLNTELIKIGFEKLVGFKSKSFDEGFYLGDGLPFEYRFEKFHYERDLEKEKEIYNKLNPNDEKFIFTHNINIDKIRKDLKIIENPTQYKLFDLLYTIERAEEVHLMESSLKCLVNSYNMDKPKFFYHQYVRNYDEYHNTKGLNKFEIIY
jgi:hypothetical protein